MASNNTENIHHKFIAKYDALRDIATYINYIMEKFESAASSRVAQSRKEICDSLRENVNGLSLQIEDSFMNYQNYSMPSLVEHYKVCTDSREDMRSVYSKYQKVICSNNVLDDLNQLFRALHNICDYLSQSRGFKTFIKSVHDINADLRLFDVGVVYVEPDNNALVEDMKSFLIDTHNAELDAEQDMYSEIEHTEIVTVNTNVLSRLDFEEAMNRICTAFTDQKIIFTPEKTNPNRCNCGEEMILYTEDAELRCDECGRVVLLQGTVYDDSQPDSQGSAQGTKNKRYDPKRHCDKRLMQIQAKEEWKVSEDVISRLDKRAMREYRHGDGLRSMKGMPCRQIRRWLKEENLTKHNHHAPYIRKIITGLHGAAVVPPQLTPEEEQEVLIDFSTAMACYEKVTLTDEYRRKYEKDRGRSRQRTKPNRFYYWFVLFKILSQKLRGDPRLSRILECIHLQSSATLAKDDDIWAMMCACPEMNKYHAEPTNRNIAEINM
jgi:hypothetical protein